MDDHDWDKLDHVPSGCRAVFPVTNGKEQRWQVGPDKFRALLAKGYVRLGPRGDIKYLYDEITKEIDEGAWEVTGRDENDGHVLLKAIDPKTQVKQLWDKSVHNNGQYGKRVLARILGRDDAFIYPKSLYSVEDALHIFLADKPNALVVDFFAGSGTTGNVVNLMNKRDGGRRQCILVTNNEAGPKNEEKMRKKGLTPFDGEWRRNGVCLGVTIPRIKSMVLGRTAASGYKDPIKGEYLFDGGGPMSDGLEERWKFYDLTFVQPSLLDPSSDEAFETMKPLLEMRAGSLGEGNLLTNQEYESGLIITKNWSILKDNMYRGMFDNQLAKLEDSGNIEPSNHVIYNMAGWYEMEKPGYTVVDQYGDYLDAMNIVNREIARPPKKFRNK